MAENVDLLGDAVGLDITVDETESSGGDFNADIYASETGTDRKIMWFALDWRELPERKASRIIIEKPADLDDQAAWPEQFDYIKDVCTKMKKAFKKYI